MDGRLKLNELITRRFRLGEINAALRALAAGEVARAVLEISLGDPMRKSEIG